MGKSPTGICRENNGYVKIPAQPVVSSSCFPKFSPFLPQIEYYKCLFLAKETDACKVLFFLMAFSSPQFSLFTAVHKHYSLQQWKEFASQNPECLEHVAASSGTGSSDFEQLEQILEAIPQVKYICLDVANGYSEHFVEFVKDVRKRFPKHTIMAGNVVTGEMVEELILSGADIIKVGIGPGKLLPWGPWATSTLANACGALHCSHYILLRLRVHHPEENWSGVPTAQCSDGVCRCCSWPQRPHHLRWRLQLSWGCGQGFRGRS